MRVMRRSKTQTNKQTNKENNNYFLDAGKQRRLDRQSPTSEPLQWKTETNILPPRRRKVKKVRVRKKEKVAMEEKAVRVRNLARMPKLKCCRTPLLQLD